MASITEVLVGLVGVGAKVLVEVSFELWVTHSLAGHGVQVGNNIQDEVLAGPIFEDSLFLGC